MMKNKIIDVSIIFVNYNTAKLTCQAIASVIKNTSGILYEIIVVDNDSKDDSVNLISESFPSINLIENKTNEGFGRANNVGLRIAKGKYCFLLNTDTYLLNNAIKILFDFMESGKNKNVAVVGGMLFKQNLETNVFAGNFPDYQNFINNSLLKYLYKYKKPRSIKNIPRLPKVSIEVDYVSGADFFVRKEVLDKIGVFDKRFFLYFEETELCFRIKQKLPNTKCMIEPKAEIVHISQGSNKDTARNLRFRKQFIKSKAIYYSITEGLFKGFLFRIVSLKRLYFNEK
ncbi:glycosyltransferase family 2 protein [Tenacibaculum sp. 1_MG-2023]|uniref:glycosyltransferase family 2 protein n=1 Tax=Tenacibaculum sp. 1_MG-2023 TaxID=3062653 RepID=UPI0026E3039D|nr:glycosyltransferase family 2 protein [Tenacibaculum sp. 1_MG-2023]MDO6600692.1 glycosyltransferase family 2 protein [Tenacibaculum sp. 1_MG-2023]